MNIRYIILLYIACGSLYCAACPCCVGAVDAESAPFFSDDCYTDKQPPTPQQPQQSEQGVRHE